MNVRLYIRHSILALLFVLMNIHFAAAQESDQAMPCILVLGDSLAFGTQVVEMPPIGFATIQTEPFSMILAKTLQSRSYIHVAIYDASVPAVSLTDRSETVYTDTSRYQSALALNCSFTIMFPILNELKYAPDKEDLGDYNTAITKVVWEIIRSSPDTQLFLLKYYFAPLEQVGRRTYNKNVTPETIVKLNTVYDILCEIFDRVYCVDIEYILLPIDDYVSKSISKAEYDNYFYYGLSQDDQSVINQFFAASLNGSANADGLHLNYAGKDRLAQYLFDEMIQIKSSLFETPFAPFLQKF